MSGAEEELRAENEKLKKEVEDLKAKTKAWKDSVKQQLNEASTKNKALREELKAARAAKDGGAAEASEAQSIGAEAAIRLQVEQEMKGRFQLKDSAIAELQRDVAEAKAALVTEKEAHAQQLARAEQKHTDAMQNETRRLTDEFTLKEQAIRHEIQTAVEKERRNQEGVLSAKLAALRKEHEGVCADLRAQVDAHAASDDQKTNDLLRNEIARLTAKNKTDSARHEEELKSVRSRVEASMESELHQRDEQIQTLQMLLSSAQKDVVAYQQSAAHFADTQLALEQKTSHTVNGLKATIASLQTEVQSLRKSKAAAESERDAALVALQDLKDDATIREQAMDELFSGDLNKGAVLQLEAELAAANADRAAARRELEASRASASELSERCHTLEEEAERYGHELKAKEDLLEKKVQRVKDTERKLKDTQRDLLMAQQLNASNTLNNGGGGGGGANGGVTVGSGRASPGPGGAPGSANLVGQASEMYRRYRRLLPFAIIAFFLLAGMWVGAEGGAKNTTSAAKIAAGDSAVATIQREFNQMKSDLTQCQEKLRKCSP